MEFIIILIYNLIMLDDFKSLESEIDPKMVGGWLVNKPSYPHAVSLTSYEPEGEPMYRTFCGGSIIDQLWILTAAHCVLGEDIESLYIIFGQTMFSYDQINLDNTRKIAKYIVYKSYNNTKLGKKDITLIKMEKSIDFSNVAKPITLIEENEPIESNYSVVTGFRKYFGKKLLVANNFLILKSPEQCNNTGFWVKDEQICGTWTKDQTVCYGDSGSGLLTLRENSQVILVGVLSVATPLDEVDDCTGKKITAFFMRVSYFLKWIRKTMHTY